MTQRPQHIYLDFDRTLFDTNQCLGVLQNCCSELCGISLEKYKSEVLTHYHTDGEMRYYDLFGHLGAYGLGQTEVSRGLRNKLGGKDFMFSDVPDFLQFLGGQHFAVSILSYGPKNFQHFKFNLVPRLGSVHFVSTLGSKGEYIRHHSKGTSLLIDDKVVADLPDSCEQWVMDRSQKIPIAQVNGRTVINSLVAAQTLLESLVGYNKSHETY